MSPHATQGASTTTRTSLVFDLNSEDWLTEVSVNNGIVENALRENIKVIARSASSQKVFDLHKRISLEKFEVWQQPDARWAARVALAWRPGGKASVGTAEGDGSSHGQVRCAAEATTRALELSVGGTMAITVLAVKAIDGFDTVLAVVSLTSNVDTPAERLAGACLINGEPARAAVLAVLSATNRQLGRMLGGTSQAAVFYSSDQESESKGTD